MGGRNITKYLTKNFSKAKKIHNIILKDGYKQLSWQIASFLCLGALLAGLIPSALVASAYAAGNESYSMGQGLSEPCSPYSTAQVFGAPLNTPNANNWGCLPNITGSTSSFNLSSITPNHEVVVALDELQDITYGTTITFQWYNSNNKLLYSYSAAIPSPQSYGYAYWYWDYIYSYIGYDGWEINSNGNYYAVITNSATGARQTMNFTVTGISPLSVATPTASQSSIIQGNSTTLSDSGATGEIAPYSYQWSEEAPGQTVYSTIPGATSLSYPFSTTSSSATGTYNFELTTLDSSTPSNTVTSSPVSVVVNPFVIKSEIINGLTFILDNNNSSNGSGAIINPYAVWQGWQGPGYYFFPSRSAETGSSISTVQQLNAYNIALFQSNLGSPYTNAQFTPVNILPPKSLNQDVTTANQLIDQAQMTESADFNKTSFYKALDKKYNINITNSTPLSVCGGNAIVTYTAPDGSQITVTRDMSTGDTDVQSIADNFNIDATYTKPLNISAGGYLVDNKKIYVATGTASAYVNFINPKACPLLSIQNNLLELNLNGNADQLILQGNVGDRTVTSTYNVTYPQVGAAAGAGGATLVLSRAASYLTDTLASVYGDVCTPFPEVCALLEDLLGSGATINTDTGGVSNFPDIGIVGVE